MTLSSSEITAILPELLILVGACSALLADLFARNRDNQIAYWTAQVSLVIAAALTFASFGQPTGSLFFGMLVDDEIARLLRLFILISAFGAFYYSKQYVAERSIPTGEYYVLGLFSVIGMLMLVSANSLLTIFMGLELLSFPLYAMVALRRESGVATEAALKYFVMGAIASGMLLYGMSIIYGVAGSLAINEVSAAMTQAVLTDMDSSLITSFALVFIVAGIGFKLAAAPFHMWAPDVYTGAPNAVTLFLSTAPKLAAFGMLLRLLIFALPELFEQWQQLLIILAVFSIAVGNVLAIAQQNIKRMLAYSGIAHIGFMLLGVLAGTQEGYAAALFYIIVYALMSLAAFGMIVLLSRAGAEVENIADFKGLSQRSPWLAFLVLLVMFSMAGMPPTVGFFAKLLVLKSIVDVQIMWLALFAVIFAVVGAFYYLRIVKIMYFEAPDNATSIAIPRDMQAVISVNGAALLLLGLFPMLLVQACRTAFGL